MPEIIFTDSAGRRKGRFHQSSKRGAPIAIILHPHPQFGGTTNNRIVHPLYNVFAERGFSLLRFNFRRLGQRQGSFEYGDRELANPSVALDRAQVVNPSASAFWIVGVSFGASSRVRLLMLRAEIDSFASIAPPANRFNFSFLAPFPRSGLFIHGELDRAAPLEEVRKLIEKLRTQKSAIIEHTVAQGANDFF